MSDIGIGEDTREVRTRSDLSSSFHLRRETGVLILELKINYKLHVPSSLSLHFLLL